MRHDEAPLGNDEQGLEEGEYPADDGVQAKAEPVQDNLPDAEPEDQNKNNGTPMDIDRELGEIKESGENVQAEQRFNKKKKLKDDSANLQWLGDKVRSKSVYCVNYPFSQAVADVAEAIIGAAYVTGGRETALRVTKAINIPVPHVDRWTDFGRKALAPPPEVTAKLKPGSIEAVEAIIGHKFDHPHLLAQALVSLISISLRKICD